MAKDNNFSGMAHNALTAETTIVGKIVSPMDSLFKWAMSMVYPG